MNHLEEYAGLIERREVIAGYWIKKAVHSLVRDLQEPDYVYDTTEAEKRIRFI